MPLTKKEKKIKSKMKKTYGSKKKADSVFYAMVNSGKFGAKAKKRHKRKASKRKK